MTPTVPRSLSPTPRLIGAVTPPGWVACLLQGGISPPRGHAQLLALCAGAAAALHPLSDGLSRDGERAVPERGKNKKKPKPPNPEVQNLLFSRAEVRQQRGQNQAGGWCRGSQPSRGHGAGRQQPRTPASPQGACTIPQAPCSCLAFSFLAKITPEHVSTLSFQESHFGEAFPPLLFPPQTQTRGRAVLLGVRAGLPRIRPSPALTPKRCRRGTGGLWPLVGMFLVSSIHGAVRTRVCTCREPHGSPAQRDGESRAKEMGLRAPSTMQASEEGGAWSSLHFVILWTEILLPEEHCSSIKP